MSGTIANVRPPAAQLDGAKRRQVLRQYRRSQRRDSLRALALVAPLCVFLAVMFGWPLATMLTRAVSNDDFGAVLHRTSASLAEWDGTGTPSERVYADFAADLRQARDEQTMGQVTSALNFEWTGARSLLMRTVRQLSSEPENGWKEKLIETAPDWGNPDLWILIKRLAQPYTSRHFLAALDLEQAADGSIQGVGPEKAIYVTLFWRTLWVSAAVAGLCLVLGYPLATLLARLPLKTSNLLMMLVLLPFWTSLLVRTTSWMVLLQDNGVINSMLVWLGLVSDGNRLSLIFNVTGTLIAMTHVLLPFMILPLYSVMKSIPPSYVRAALSLGASPVTAFWQVYLPQTIPGVLAGTLMVFVLAVGYYITPALVGGQSGQLISNIIAYHMQQSLNWGLAGALGSLLLVGVLLVYWLFNRLTGGQGLRMG
ncbi:ABC transporter permease [Paracoccus sp. 11-3]|uniref:ABC transporter permease n=1 Tax=Paracoccus amoyensis TaxID=2760093 RepID=A0A926GH62_9RHOB|nr:ABC transporter permease [Paracoccus amoyensis]MBC9248566.1 ABC transporter permease [Paracoccus amoyensis]